MPSAAATPFPLGVYVGNPHGNDPGSEAWFEGNFASFTRQMGAAPAFMDTFVDNRQDPSRWADNAAWTAWSWAKSPVVGHAVTPVIGVPLASNDSWSDGGAFFRAIAAGQYDAAYKGIVDAWAGQGYATTYMRLGYEMNANFMAWSAEANPDVAADWVAAFRHVAALMKAEGAATGTAVNIVWNPAAINWTNLPTASLYPGDGYVDVIGTDAYSPVYPRDLTDFAAGGATKASDLAAWAAEAANRVHFWDHPSASEWHPGGEAGTGWSVDDAIALAKQHGKPLGIAETGAGNNGTTTGPADDPAFPAWLAAKLASAEAGGVTVAFVNIWATDQWDGAWGFLNGENPKEAAAWASHFGALAPASSTAAASTAPSTAPQPAAMLAYQGGGASHDGVLAMDAPNAGAPDYLHWQYIYAGSDSVVLSTQVPDVFIHAGSGDDAIQVTSGRNVLDGGTGSNFLTGGSGIDTFFTDARGSAVVWNTLVNFHAGDAATLWGFTPGVSSYRWEAAATGAAGAEGATLRANIVGGAGRTGDGIDASITFAGLTVEQAKGLQVATGTQPAGSYLYLHAPVA